MRKWTPMTDEELDAQIEAARERARIANMIEPRARSARYDADSGMIEIVLTNGCFFAFPAELGQGLRGASPEELAEVEVMPGGEGLHWERLDADLLVPSLLRGVFGTRRWMQEIGLWEAPDPAEVQAAGSS
ncbi:DUF2442 domain-containing protein [soil metagenome]